MENTNLKYKKIISNIIREYQVVAFTKEEYTKIKSEKLSVEEK